MAKNGKASGRKRSGKSLLKMNATELGQATEEFNNEFVADSFGKPTEKQKDQLRRAKRKRGRPKIGKGAKVVSVSIEEELLTETDRLAKRLKMKRAELIARGLRAILNEEVPVET